ncbi:MAG: P1 family peptidase [Alphaproteobacteria bacterium]|jgi:D-aminopeptidase|nr:P1 family peptidase [Rhodospirillaceae bacterium]MBT6205639.1 P1 family peptidase [Rhodospirillaceae bacterium]MBT6509389.1 P1 family peptidase [Rhodospirillaceae bacterium]MDG2482141.1 P1 family peptidase [Alphaproteobacteria bacterium]
MTNPLLATPSGKTRARALGIPFDGLPGANNAITDVPGVEVGFCTLIEGEGGPLVVGEGPVRTGVTAILPCGKARPGAPVWAGQHSLNGNGELTGSWWIEEAGKADGPITITNTHSCGVARDATIEWLHKFADSYGDGPSWGLPVAGETYDGWLNDINGFHVTREHVFEAINNAAGGALEEGSVGGGTGMMLYGHKGGSGTASRQVGYEGSAYTVGAFVQANFGLRSQLTIGGIPMAEHLPGPEPYASDTGSIIAIVATDAPIISHQCKRLTRRISLGVGKGGSISGHGSGDIFMAFTTAGSEALDSHDPIVKIDMIPDHLLDPFFEAVIQAVDEAIMNVLAVSEEMVGIDNHRAEALDRERLVATLKKFGRYREPPGL